MTSPEITLHRNSPLTHIDGKLAVYYLASPYTAPTLFEMESRYLFAVTAAAELHKLGFCLIEPISMGHSQAQVMPLPREFKHWQARNHAFIDRSAAVIVLMTEGWYYSKGVADEIDYAFDTDKKVFMYHTNFIGGYDLCELDKLSYLAARASQTPQEQTILH